MSASEMARVILENIRSLKPKKHRVLIAIAGPPGSGKSTVGEILTNLMNKNLMKTSLVPMDGLHLDNETLERSNLLERKGAPETFDIGGFSSLIKKLRSKNDIKVPLFDRSADKVIKDAQIISREQDYLVIEGNYLLLDRELWRDLSKYWDYKIFLTIEQTVLKSRLIERWLGENHTYSEAEARVVNNDLINANLVNSFKIEPTLELQTV